MSAAGTGTADIAELLRARIRDIPDYPQPGIVFKDITPLLADGPAFAATVAEMAVGQTDVDKVAGIGARLHTGRAGGIRAQCGLRPSS
jgi:adenine phosphoribosyltransferase